MVDENGAFNTNKPPYKNIPYPPAKISEILFFDFINLSGSASSVIAETKTLKATELFDGEISFAEDLYLWFRISQHTDYA